MREVLVFPISKGLNRQQNTARSSKFAAAREKKELTDRTVAWAKTRAIAKFPGAVWVSIEWQIKNFANDPIDNLPASLKPILDGLVKAGVLKDDSARVIQTPIVHHVTKGENRVAIEISDEPIWRMERCTSKS